jgi:hypothetical protein
MHGKLLKNQYEGRSSNDLISLLNNIINIRISSSNSPNAIEEHIQSYSQNWEDLLEQFRMQMITQHLQVY